MDSLTILTTTLLVTFYGIYYYFKKKLNYFKDRGIPYLPGLPLTGNMTASLLRRKHFSQVIDDIYYVNSDAKYIGAFDFNKPTILLRDPELIKTITIKNFDNFPDHPYIIDETLDPLLGGSLFHMTGEKWREARNLLSPAFTSSKMKSMFDLIVKCSKNFANYLSKQTPENNKMINTKDLFTKYTNDVIATCAFGVEIDSLTDPKNDFYVLGREATNLEGMTLKIFLSRALPQVLKIFKIKIVSKKVADFFTNIVRSTVGMRDKKGISRPDMLQLMMNARNKESKHLKLDITEMTAQAFVFFFGGFDTTSTQMCIMAHELAINPDIQEKLQKEIDDVLKRFEGNLTYEIINEMPYLDAVFYEAMRRHTQVVVIERLCVKEFELPPALPGLKPFTIKPGMYVWISPGSIHRDEKYYKNPLKFDPDRYFSKKVGINDVNNLGFGIGPRACIGNRFAILEIKILFFFLLAEFNLIPNHKTMKPLQYSKKNFSVSAEGGFWASIVSRR